MADYLRGGDLVLKNTSQGSFEVLKIQDAHKGVLIASGEVLTSPYPTLHINRQEPRERMLDMRAASVNRMVLHRCNRADPTDYELSAASTQNGIEIRLSGHHGYRCLWWRADFTIDNGKVLIRGPILATDSDS